MRINRVKSEMHANNEVISDDRKYCRNVKVGDCMLSEKCSYWLQIAYNMLRDKTVTNRDEP